MIDREKLEREVAALIREHITVGYKPSERGFDPKTIFVTAEGAAHVVVHHIGVENERLRAILRRFTKKYEDQDLNHLDFRVLVKIEAEAALSSPQDGAAS